MKNGDASDGSDSLVMLEGMFRLLYWYRTLIVQEIVLVQKIILRYGSRQICRDSLDFWTRNTTSIFTAMGRPPREPCMPIRLFQAKETFERRNAPASGMIDWDLTKWIASPTLLCARTKETGYMLFSVWSHLHAT